MLKLDRVSKIYRTSQGELNALDRVSLEISEGEFVVVRGPSGCGKTTLLLTLGGMLRPTEGTVSVGGENVYSLTAAERAVFRARNIGFVFQMFHLVPYLNVHENVLLASGNTGFGGDSFGRAREILERFGLGSRLKHKPAELSAGEKQRTALARALFPRPKVLLADEPTGNLDPENARQVMEHMESFHKQGGTVIVVTHGTLADEFADRILDMREGIIAG